MEYAELQVTSNFSFLRGASHPHEIVEQAKRYNYKAIAITDRNTLAGIVRAHAAAKKEGIKVIPASRIDLLDGPSLLAYPTNKDGYASLSNLLTIGNLRAEKGKCYLYKADVFAHAKNMKWIVIPPIELDRNFELDPAFTQSLAQYRSVFENDLYIAATRFYQGTDAKYLHHLSQLSTKFSIPLVATNDVHYHTPQRRELQDVLTCVREKCTIHTAGFKLHQNAERYMKDVAEMKRLFRQYPDAITRTIEIAEACAFSLNELKYEYPHEIVPEGTTSLGHLTKLAWAGAERHYGNDIPEKIRTNILHELEFIRQMNFAEYFLTVEDIVREARNRKILCQGRGSAANSTVCYCLGVTAVDPMKHDLLFERFISHARNEPPDIDIDFEHERREEMMQYVYHKYGRNRAGIVATVTQMHQRGAIRDVGRAMGLSVDTLNKLSSGVWEFNEAWFEGDMIKDMGITRIDPHLQKTLSLTKQYIGFPRQLGQHTGGFVITNGTLSDLCPVMNATMKDRTNIEWNKDDIDELGFLKIDLLALGMLTCIRKSFDLAKQHYNVDLTLANIPQDDPKVYEMICRADTIGVFQIESRAQQSMLPRLRPSCFYDLVIEVAIVRPGPIQGDMVHPYLRRRNKEEAVDYPSKELEDILGRTLGVPLFQEQAMKIAIVGAGFTPTEADELRRSMATFKVHGMVKRFEKKLIDGMVSKGYTAEYAQRVFKQLEGFGSYGFPESHAASFAQLVYVSSWIKCYYPDIFCAALLNSQPMGFYHPAQIVGDARKHDVKVREVDVNHSFWDNTLEKNDGGTCAIRLGFRQVKGLSETDMQVLLINRTTKFEAVAELQRIALPQSSLEKLADADAFRSMGLDRRQALWEVSTKDRPIALFKKEIIKEQKATLPTMKMSEHVVQDYASIAMSLKAHPVSFLRTKLDQLNVHSTVRLGKEKDGIHIKVAGLVLVRQRPGTAKGVCFMTIEDETGIANLVIFENLFNKYQKEILQSKLVMVEGKLQIEGEVIHVIVSKVYDFSKLLRMLTPKKTDDLPLLTLAYPDETSVPTDPYKIAIRAQNEKVIPGGRNFK